MKAILFVVLCLFSPIADAQDYIDIVAPYPNRRPEHDRRAQSFLAGEHSPHSMKILADMLFNYLRGVSHPPRDDEDYEMEENIKARNLELVQDAFEKTHLRRLATPPPISRYAVSPFPPLPQPPPPPIATLEDYDIGAPGIPHLESDKPPPLPMPILRPNRLHPEYPTTVAPTSPLPSRVLLFRPSQHRKRPDEFIVRPPPQTKFNTQEGKPAKSGAAPILSINQMPYRRPFAIPLPPYAPPPVGDASHTPTAFNYRTNARVEMMKSGTLHSGGYAIPPQQKKTSIWNYAPWTPPPKKTIPASSEWLHRRKRRTA